MVGTKGEQIDAPTPIAEQMGNLTVLDTKNDRNHAIFLA